MPKEKIIEPVRKSLRLQRIDADTGISLPEKEPTSYHIREDDTPLRPPLKELTIEDMTNNNDDFEATQGYFNEKVTPYIADNIKTQKGSNSLFDDVKNVEKNLKKLRITPERVAKVVPNRIFSLAIHPTESKVLLAAGGKWGSIGFWDVLDNESEKHGVQVIKHHSRPINCLTFDIYNSSKLISTSYDGSVRIFDINAQSSSVLFAYPEDSSNYCTYHCQLTNSTYLVSVGKAGICLIDSRQPHDKTAANFNVYEKASPKMVSAHPLKQDYFLAPSSKGDCAIFDRRNPSSGSKLMKPVVNLIGHTKALSSAKFSPLTGSQVVTVAYDNKIRLFDTGSDWTKKELKPIKSINHNNQTGRWLTTFKAEWHPQRENVFFVGSMNQPRQMDVVVNNSELYALKGEDLASVCSIVQCHPTQDVIVGGNSSGRVHVFM